MDELGIILREAREAKGMTLADVQEEIRIGTKFLEALETGQFQQLPTPVHARGYLRNYARFLGLDPQPLLERLELSYTYQSQGKRPAPPPQAEINPDKPLQLPHDHPLFRPVNMEMGTGSGEGSTGSIVRFAIIIALLVTIALIATRIMNLRSQAPAGSNNTPEAGLLEFVQGLLEGESTPEPAAAATEDPLSPFPVPNTDIITSTERSQTTIISVPTPEPTRPTLPATMETIQLRLDIVERTWVRITIDDTIVFEGQIEPGELLQYEATSTANLRASNGIGIIVTVNGVQLGKLGDRQEVIDETWQTTN
ncbi:MAG: helix-turn-helix domain-containing protein [Chloroflexi bacterium]|nr:helix-turn-helix domain-containing protein [Chloroflexota bacterium]MBP8054787.1 helix-turn-helix domain-containing protein [Chloroflexota bacterium]